MSPITILERALADYSNNPETTVRQAIHRAGMYHAVPFAHALELMRMAQAGLNEETSKALGFMQEAYGDVSITEGSRNTTAEQDREAFARAIDCGKIRGMK